MTQQSSHNQQLHKCHKIKTDATVANNTGKATDAQKASIVGDIARIKVLANARFARDTGQATDTQMILFAPEHARREVNIIADLNEVAERE